MDKDELAEIAAANARFGATMAGKGLTPEQTAALISKTQPVLDRLVADGVDPDEVRFEIRKPNQY